MDTRSKPLMDIYFKNLVGYQKAMKPLIDAENDLQYRNDPISKKELTKIRLQKYLMKKIGKNL